jgi:thiamine-phosphate pyrophosphorylase
MCKSPDDPMTRSPDLLVLPRLYAIVDPAQAGGRSMVEVAEALLAAGVRLIQLRDKHASSLELYESGVRVRECVHKAAGIFILNDRADIARAVDADGVHLGQDDIPPDAARLIMGEGKLIGYSAHNPEQVREAEQSVADYVAFGPIFPTASKDKPDPVVGLEGLAEARKLARKPLVAIGGISIENARAVIGAGADSVAVIRGLIGAADIRAQAELFLAQLTSQL